MKYFAEPLVTFCGTPVEKRWSNLLMRERIIREEEEEVLKMGRWGEWRRKGVDIRSS